MGVQDVEARKEAEPDRLRGQRKGAGDQRLRGDDRRQRREHDERQEQRRRREAVEQLAAGDRRAAEEIRALSEIVEQQRGKDHREPADADRPSAEMPEVGVHGLAAGDDQHQRAEDQHRLAQPGARKEGQRHTRD